jgi:3-oxoacyl-[acyl-carrier protein] reductase
MDARTSIAVVTGASSGIGEAIARWLHADGYTVVNVDRVAPVEAPAERYVWHRADLANRGETAAVAEAIAAEHDVDTLVNNAGVARTGPLAEAGGAAFDESVDLHLFAAITMANAVVPGMKARRFGRIVNISSRAILGKRERTNYAGTKAALVAYTRVWALELGPHGITVNAIAPGPIVTELFRRSNSPEVAARLVQGTAVGRGGTPDDVANAARFLTSPSSGFVTGQVLHVCGGASLGMAPW